MDKASLVGILISLIAASGAFAAQRTAAKAGTKNILAAGRVEMERDAYTRARAMDVETIERQESEIQELRKQNEELRAKSERQDRALKAAEDRIDVLEKRLRERGI